MLARSPLSVIDCKELDESMLNENSANIPIADRRDRELTSFRNPVCCSEFVIFQSKIKFQFTAFFGQFLFVCKVDEPYSNKLDSKMIQQN